MDRADAELVADAAQGSEDDGVSDRLADSGTRTAGTPVVRSFATEQYGRSNAIGAPICVLVIEPCDHISDSPGSFVGENLRSNFFSIKNTQKD